MGLAGLGTNEGWFPANLRKRISAYARELREAVSAAMVRTVARVRGCLMMSWMERT